MHALTKPKYFMPIHGEHKHLSAHSELARSMGMAPNDIFIGENGKSAEENRAEAEKALAEYNGGESFDSLIGLYSREVPAEAYVIRGERDAVLESAIFALEDGEVSGVIENEKGFYVVLRLEKDAEYITSHFNELKEKYQGIELQNKIKARSNTLNASESEYVSSLAYEEIK